MINVFEYEMYKSFDAAVAAAASDCYVNRKCRQKSRHRERNMAVRLKIDNCSLNIIFMTYVSSMTEIIKVMSKNK